MMTIGDVEDLAEGLGAKLLEQLREECPHGRLSKRDCDVCTCLVIEEGLTLAVVIALGKG